MLISSMTICKILQHFIGQYLVLKLMERNYLLEILQLKRHFRLLIMSRLTQSATDTIYR
jgi:hypothetical protein